MYVLTSCKIRRDLREQLASANPSITYQFCTSIEEAEEYLPKADVLLTYGEDLDEEKVERAKNLKWIMVLSAGIDQMPFNKIEEKGIIVTNSKGIHKTPMAEYAISMLLQVCRQAKTIIDQERSHDWDRSVKMTEISGKTMLIAGTGAIGQEVARLAKAFRMRTIGVSRSGKPKEFFDEVYIEDEGLAVVGDADFIVAVLPSTPETKDFFRKEHFEQMKSTSIFLNMGRGDVVNSTVLMEALQDREIEHAVLDVFDKEPLPEAHPFWEMPNVTVTPHISGISPEYQPRALDIYEKNLEVFLEYKNDFINLVDPRKGY